MSIKEFELNDKMIIANQLKELRLKDNLTQKQLGDYQNKQY